MSDYLYKEIGERFIIQAIYRTLRKYDISWKKGTKKYSEQNIEKVKKFLADNYWLSSHNFLLAMDECGFNLGEVPRYAWSRKGLRAVVPRPGQRGFNYTFILCIQNINKQAVVSYKLIENERGGKKQGTNALDFYNFLKDISLPTNEKCYLLLDNARIHYTTKKLRELGLSIEELAVQKNIILVYLPPHSPEINPSEKCFNNIRHNIEKNRPRTHEELKLIIDKEMVKLQQQNLTKYFRSCFDYFVLK
jgi:transposase